MSAIILAPGPHARQEVEKGVRRAVVGIRVTVSLDAAVVRVSSHLSFMFRRSSEVSMMVVRNQTQTLLATTWVKPNRTNALCLLMAICEWSEEVGLISVICESTVRINKQEYG